MPEEFKNPPLWILRQAIFSSGGRLDKSRPEWKEPIVKIKNFSPRRCPVTWLDKDTNTVMTLEGNKVVPYKGGEFAVFPRKPVLDGNLNRGEYFQWIGSRIPISVYAKCRACSAVFWTEAARKAHKNSCGRILAEAYKKLRADKHRATGQYLCVVCSQGTSKLIWGVPLCLGKCEESWKFGGMSVGNERIPQVLANAIKLVSK